MKYYLYVIRSGNSQYVGTTKDLKDRLNRHNSGQNISTRHRKDWRLVYFEKFNTLSEARQKENNIKKRRKSFAVPLSGQKI